MHDRRPITLTTDFGTQDPYVGVMKGVILGINPGATIVDITHEIQPQAISQGAFIVATSHRFFPKGTIHVAVVDPGVGTSRAAMLLVTGSAYYLAPDNGLLSFILREGSSREAGPADGCRVPVPPEYQAYHLTNPDLWVHPVSSTFHGRDVFAPVAAHLSLGLPVERVGQRVYNVVWLPLNEPRWESGRLVGEIVHIDRYGNLISNIPPSLLPEAAAVTIEVKGHAIAGISPSYEEGGWLLAVVGSHGTLEVSVRNGSAARRLQAAVGDVIRVGPAPQTASA